MKNGNKCIICEKTLRTKGYNPEPVLNSDLGHCCPSCYAKIILPVKRAMLRVSQDTEQKESGQKMFELQYNKAMLSEAESR